MDAVGAKLNLVQGHLGPEGNPGAKPLPEPLLPDRISPPQECEPAPLSTSWQGLKAIGLENGHDRFLDIVAGSELNLTGEPAAGCRSDCSPSRSTSRKEQEEGQDKTGKQEVPDGGIHGRKCAPPVPGSKQPGRPLGPPGPKSALTQAVTCPTSALMPESSFSDDLQALDTTALKSRLSELRRYL